ncbi:MAG TPA: orotidine-5'-phosphate decarboxylase [Verrucomicrobia bacterium]|nr:orotidine-5'-phosphate decarboxylase [Verrucomicrobiota bacterium]
MKSELIVALDVQSTPQAIAVMETLPSQILWYKIGLELYCSEGPAILNEALSRGKKIFLDLKLHDIPRTVERAVKAVASLGADMLTIHSSGGREMIRAAVEAAGASPKAPRIVAVTALTSLDTKDLQDLGIQRSTADQVAALAELALSSGAHGLVSSAQEVGALRKRFGAQPILITPGIRLPTDQVGDQKRVATPAGAVRDGASFLVVGRPILDAAEPTEAARRILADMEPA